VSANTVLSGHVLVSGRSQLLDCMLLSAGAGTVVLRASRGGMPWVGRSVRVRCASLPRRQVVGDAARQSPLPRTLAGRPQAIVCHCHSDTVRAALTVAMQGMLGHEPLQTPGVPLSVSNSVCSRIL
jgi:hypothetical protein